MVPYVTKNTHHGWRVILIIMGGINFSQDGGIMGGNCVHGL